MKQGKIIAKTKPHKLFFPPLFLIVFIILILLASNF